MPTDILEFEVRNTIKAKIEYAPAEAVPAGFLVVRDAHNKLQAKIELTPENIDSWIDITEPVQRVECGIVEAELLRTLGNGRWSTKLYLHASPGGGGAEDLERGKLNHLDPCVLFRRKL